MAFRVLAGVLFVLGILFAFGWILTEDVARAVGVIAAGLLCLVLSTVPIGTVP
jgi:hypothetical protein